MTRDEMWHKACMRFEEWACKYADKNVTDGQFFNELCCSVYAGEEFEESREPITLDSDYQFVYKGYMFELSSCTTLSSTAQVFDAAETFKQGKTKPIFTDRYVCWMYGHKDLNGKTKAQSEHPADWAAAVYLVPDAWAWGACDDCIPGVQVQALILEKIDKFLEQNPDL